MGKGFSGKGVGGNADEWKKVMARMLSDAADSLAQVETVIQREGIECYWRMNGRFSGAYTPRHYADQQAKIATYNSKALGTYMVPRERQREAIAADFYHGGMLVERHRAAASRALLRGPAQRRVTRRREVCAPRRREDRAQVGQLGGRGAFACSTSTRHARGARGRGGHQRLHHRADADAQAPSGARSPATSSRPRKCPRIWRRACIPSTGRQRHPSACCATTGSRRTTSA